MLQAAHVPLSELENPAEFAARHLGPDAADEAHMLSVIGAASRRALTSRSNFPPATSRLSSVRRSPTPMSPRPSLALASQ